MRGAWLGCSWRLPRWAYLRDRRDDPRDILRARQAVIAVLDHRQYHVVGRQPMGQSEGVAPRHVRILRPLQDANWAADLDGAAKEQMVAAFLDQGAGDRIGIA